jgi:hypothetical protein
MNTLLSSMSAESTQKATSVKRSMGIAAMSVRASCPPRERRREDGRRSGKGWQRLGAGQADNKRKRCREGKPCFEFIITEPSGFTGLFKCTSILWSAPVPLSNLQVCRHLGRCPRQHRSRGRARGRSLSVVWQTTGISNWSVARVPNWLKL